ncbi:uncharacterized protein LOC143460952 [Clavelina lepadiformis]|uniref:Uncharacterized protein n=1 Tax=Clavelina lepadiformis TaxID=159417 RepID=A0ABP0FU75_CLALP
MVKQTKELKKNLMYQLIQVLSPTGRRYFRFFQLILCSAGILMCNPFDFSYVQNETRLRKSFRQHQTYCMQNAPKDKLLVYDIKDGWEPLCRFLGKDVPDKPFPHENAGGVIMNRWMKVHPALIRMQREFAVCLATLVALGAFGIYKLHSSRIVKIGLFTFRFMERFKRV